MTHYIGRCRCCYMMYSTMPDSDTCRACGGTVERGTFTVDESGDFKMAPVTLPPDATITFPYSLDRATLRAILAGMAMQYYLENHRETVVRWLAEQSVKNADALLSELDRTQEPRT